MAQLSESVQRVIDELTRLPGIGRKSAERLTYHLLRVPKEEALALADAIRAVSMGAGPVLPFGGRRDL